MDLFRPDFDTRPFARRGDHLKELAMPLGGIGTGSISLDGRGLLADWEIMGRPSKGLIPEYTFPALFVRHGDGITQAIRVAGPRKKDFVGAGTGFWEYAQGQFFKAMEGLPCFDEIVYTGTFPVARVEFHKQDFPLQVELAAFNPFIPHELADSSLPLASLTYRLTNHSEHEVEAVLAWSVQNPIAVDQTISEDDRAKNIALRMEGLSGIHFTNERYGEDELRHGDFVVATSWPDVQLLDRWSDEGWWDTVRAFWNAFRAEGAFPAPISTDSNYRVPGSVGCRVTLAPGESAEIPFVFAWRFPNNRKVWTSEDPIWKQHYATQWPSSVQAARHFLLNREDLTKRTLLFEDALYGGTLDPVIKESVGAPLSTLKSTTLLRLEDGTFWAWEGCSSQEGCCEGTCTHVWNYALAHAYLFPEIQKSFLDASLSHGFNCGPAGEDGAMRFRLPIPLTTQTDLWHAASDGQLGEVIQAYRDWRLTGDEETLRQRWPAIRKALSYAWVQWDRDRDGLVDGDQHNTYDINFQGPNPLTQFFYLGALRAVERIARHLGQERADELAAMADQGSRLTEERLFNGEYFVQEGDFTDRGSARYQHGPGCLSDQVFGQLSATIAGLGDLVDPALMQAALTAIVQFNYRDRLGEHENLQRVYCVSDEPGLLLCTWPHGGQPYFPFVYSDEVWTGIEYQVASHLSLVGMETEATRLASAVRTRYDGRRRNPWNEYECGSHYARALASYGLLLGLTGMRYDAVVGTLEFRQEPFQAMWSIPGAYGVAERRADGTLQVEVRGGALSEHVRW